MLYDLPNLLAIIIVVFVSFNLKLIPSWVAVVLCSYAFVPFFLNDVLFPASYMPDQFKYFRLVQSIRSGDIDYGNIAKTVEVSSWLMAVIPLPFVETIKSLGFYNRFIITILIIWLYYKKKLRGWPFLFVLFYPSLLLYSSLSLRDTLIATFMVISVILFIEKKKLLAFCFSLPLIIIKFQNFFLILIFFYIFLIFKKNTVVYRFRYFFTIIILVSILPFINVIIDALDFYRLAMYQEDGGEDAAYIHIGNLQRFLILAIQSSPYFMLKPFPWEASGFLQLVQSVENLLIFTAVLFVFFKSYKIDKLLACKWLVILFISLAVYGLVVFNYGTAVRYKFPFILMFFVGVAYDLHYNKGMILWKKI